MVRTRIAPSPTGIPHIGNTRTALFDYLWAKHNNGVFILRIEDTDQARKVEGAEEKIEEILNWLGIIPDEKYVQSQRLDLYKEKTEELIKNGFAKREEGAVRFIVPKGKTLEWTDAVGNRKISFNSNDVENFIILKSDGFPTYHLASVIDDTEMKISHVLRGEEWVSSTPKHLLLYEAFGWQPPVFVHLPVILGSDHQKLSKRHGAKSALDYRNDGYMSDAVNNYMALLGWNPGDNKEIMSMQEMIDLFDLKDVNTASPIFDPKKLDWMNGEYIRKSEVSTLKSQIISQNQKVTEIDDKTLEQLIPLAQTRMTTLNDFYPLVQFLIEHKTLDLSDQEKEVAKTLKEKLEALSDWSEEGILSIMREVLTQFNIKMPVLYRILTGSERGLPLPQITALLGKEWVLKQL